MDEDEEDEVRKGFRVSQGVRREEIFSKRFEF